MQTTYPAALGQLFSDIVEQHKERIALRYDTRVVTYVELDALADKIAAFLREQGVGKHDVIGIFGSKEPIVYASILASLKLGAIYTNIDEENPKVRLEKIILTAQPKILISDHQPSSDITSSAQELEIPLFFLEEARLEAYDGSASQAATEVTGSDPAYIMFTSGSTGMPKGVLVSHANIISFFSWSIERYGVTPEDIFAQVSPLYFDNSVFDLYTALFSGASLAPIKKERLKSPLELVKSVDQLGCTIFFSVPSLLIYLTTMRVLDGSVMQRVRTFTFGGEGYPKSELKKLYDLYSPSATFINVYGPTEGTCICTSYEITEMDFKELEGLPPLGRLNRGFDHLLLDEHRKPVEVGETGELCLLGPNIALGYYNDSKRSDQVFIANPLQKRFVQKMYLTGDLVDVDEEGLLHFRGRRDNQIKHMGYRIELEEIENAINTLAFVNQSAVIYERVQSGYGKIIAFIATDDEIQEREIKQVLQGFLPVYMIPNILHKQSHLPKNANGKVDKVYLRNTL